MITKYTPLILAGGKGGRLQSVSKGLPKPLMEINGKTFISFLLEKLYKAGFKKTYISVGFKSKEFVKKLGNKYKNIDLHYILETTPLGTGGAVVNAFKEINKKELLIFNGDSFCNFHLKKFLEFYKDRMDILMLTVRVKNSLRYGNIRISKNHKILEFSEKTGNKKIINAGVYILKRKIFSQKVEGKFSLENKIFTNVKENFYYYLTKGSFIDIGTPESYRLAKKILR